MTSPRPERRVNEPLLPALVAGLAAEVSRLRQTVVRELDRRPTEAATRYARVVSVISLLIVMLVGIQLYNRTSTACSAGRKSETAITGVIEGRIHSLADLKRLYGFSIPQPACDIGFPLSAHSPGALWPTDDNLIGLGVWGGWMIATVSLAGIYRRRADREDDRNTRRILEDVPAALTQKEEA